MTLLPHCILRSAVGLVLSAVIVMRVAVHPQRARHKQQLLALRTVV